MSAFVIKAFLVALVVSDTLITEPAKYGELYIKIKNYKFNVSNCQPKIWVSSEVSSQWVKSISSQQGSHQKNQNRNGTRVICYSKRFVFRVCPVSEGYVLGQGQAQYGYGNWGTMAVCQWIVIHHSQGLAQYGVWFFISAPDISIVNWYLCCN